MTVLSKLILLKKILRSITDENVREFAEKMGRLEIRIVKVKLKNGTIEILATNLDSSKYNRAYLKEIYGKRWAIETGYDKLKNLIRIEDFYWNQTRNHRTRFLCRHIHV